MNDLSEIVEGLKLAAVNSQNLNEQMGIVVNEVKSIKIDQTMIKESLDKVSDRMDTLEYHTNISGAQSDVIKTTAKRSVYRVLGDDEDLVAKYYRSFICKAYSDASKYAGMASRIINTERGNYQRVIDYLDSWQPHGGATALMEEIDRKAEANRKAREQGY